MKRLKKVKKSTRNHDLNSVGVKKKIRRAQADGEGGSMEPVESS